MATSVSPYAGQHLPEALLIDENRIQKDYEADVPLPDKIELSTSGYRGRAGDGTFTAKHVSAIVQAICDYRKENNITGPIFFGKDTHYLSLLARKTALEIVVGNGMKLYIDSDQRFVPTPVISHRIIKYNAAHPDALSDGLIFSPSHNPPDDGGFKYNPPYGGSSNDPVSKFLQERVSYYFKHLDEVKRKPLTDENDPLIFTFDYVSDYVNDLQNVIDIDAIQKSGLTILADSQGGAAMSYWPRIAETYNLRIVNRNIRFDPRFAFMCADFDGRIRPDCSSEFSERKFLQKGQKFPLAFCNDPDADRFGICCCDDTHILNPNAFLCVALDYLLTHRPKWNKQLKIGKTFPTSALVNRIAAAYGVEVVETPVGFKWFSEDFYHGKFLFAGEESSGMTFLDRNGAVWTTDKDGIIPCLLSAEIFVKTGLHPCEYYEKVTEKFGIPYSGRTNIVITPEIRRKIRATTPEQLGIDTLCGEPIIEYVTTLNNGTIPVGGIKMITRNQWLAIRPSGNECICKIYAESFRSEEGLNDLLAEGERLFHKLAGI